jgi:hypothetical protein
MNWSTLLFVAVLLFWPLSLTVAMRSMRRRHGANSGALHDGPSTAVGDDDRNERIAELEREIAELRSINNEHRFAGSRRA